MKREVRKMKKGFTLIELLVVIAIIAILGCDATTCIEQSKGKGKNGFLFE